MADLQHAVHWLSLATTMTLHQQIIQAVRRYLAGEQTVRDLAAWIRPATWNVHKLSDSATEALAGEIERYLAEYDRAHRTESELRALLDVAVAQQAPLGH